MTKKHLIGALAVFATVGSLYFLLHKPAEPGAALATDASAALGQRAAQEVAQLLGGKGKIAVLMLAPDPSPGYTTLMTSFNQEVKKRGIKIAAIRIFSGGLNALMLGHGPSATDWAALGDPALGAGAIVSFAGAPRNSADLPKSSVIRPPLIVVDLFGLKKGADLPSLVEGKTVALALVPINAVEVAAAKNQTNFFDRYYKILLAPGR